jgi:hypothetical protein
MYDQDRGKALSLTAIITLAGLVIVVIGAHSLFPELLFFSIVVVLIGVIVVIVGHLFFWERTRRYVSGRLRRKKYDSFARKYFEDFMGFVNSFTSLREFNSPLQGIVAILSDLKQVSTKDSSWINNRVTEFPYVMQNSLNSFKQRLDELRFCKSEINEKLLSTLVKEFENYIMLHKTLYVDLTVRTAREIGLEHISEATKRAYREYKEDYNQFIIEYTRFAKKTSKEIGVFSQYLPKAPEL